MNSTHQTVNERPTRSAGHRPSGTARLVRLGWSVAGLAAIALVAAACGGGGSSSSGAGSYGAYGRAPATSSGSASATIVDLGGSKLGQTLVDGQGRTLYLFEADKPGKSNCTGACTSAWPPYVSHGTPQAGAGVTGALLGTSLRGDGAAQVTYHGHPLYYYGGDSRPGDTTGQGLDAFGAKWYVLASSGNKIATG
jgi:predicted lipoprotein with Yx(FWY)xxD motif